MQSSTVDLMRDQVRAIFRALTGTELPAVETKHAPSETPISAEEVARRFADLEALARSPPAVTERVPPFSFSPPIDVFEDDRGLLVEVAVPGADKDDVKVELDGERLNISGVRSGERLSNGRTC